MNRIGVRKKIQYGGDFFIMRRYTKEEIHTFLRKSQAITRFRNHFHLMNMTIYNRKWGLFYDNRKEDLLNYYFERFLEYMIENGWFMKKPSKLNKEIKNQVRAWSLVVRGREAVDAARRKEEEKARKKAEKMSDDEVKAELERLKKELGSFGGSI